MIQEPAAKRTFAFFDGQNLYHAAKEAFGYHVPNYNPQALARKVCELRGWDLKAGFFYTGVPDKRDDQRWNYFWTAKLGVIGSRGIEVYSRPLRYRNQKVALPSGGQTTILVGQEKGIDVRLALDIVRYARDEAYDIALVFSQDQDLSEVADEIRAIARLQKRWIKMASAFPVSPTTLNKRGINGTDWIEIDRTTYDVCLDLNDYRHKGQ